MWGSMPAGTKSSEEDLMNISRNGSHTLSIYISTAITVALSALFISCGEEKIEWNEQMVHEAL